MESEIIIKIITTIISTVLAFLLGHFFTKFNNLKKEKVEKTEQDNQEYLAMKETCKYMLRKSLKEDCAFYTQQGYCSVEDKIEIENTYNIYHTQLHGNGAGTRYYNNIIALPDALPLRR